MSETLHIHPDQLPALVDIFKKGFYRGKQLTYRKGKWWICEKGTWLLIDESQLRLEVTLVLSQCVHIDWEYYLNEHGQLVCTDEEDQVITYTMVNDVMDALREMSAP